MRAISQHIEGSGGAGRAICIERARASRAMDVTDYE